MTTEPGHPVPVRRLRSVQVRILASYVGLLTLATALSVVVAREVLVAQLDSRIESELVQEAGELEQLALQGQDPETSQPFGDRVERIFDVHLSRNIPSRNEALLTFVDGRPYTRTRTVVDYRLDQDADLVELWGDLEVTDRGSVETPAGRVDYLAVPLRAGERVPGVFVTAIFRDRAQDQLTAPLLAVGAVGLVVLLAGSVLAWRLSEDVLGRVRRVTRTARAINDTDLRRRIDVDGQDEIAELADTFNAMLDRLDASFTTQRQFLDDAGHELRTPITIARGHLELLGDDPQEQQETVALALPDELSRMSRIVNDLLLLAKAERARLPRARAGGPRRADRRARRQDARAGRPRVGAGAPSATGVVEADRQRLTQAVVQLAQNAVQHTPEGDEIALGDRRRRTAQLRLWVRDTGPGIAPEEQDRIFAQVRARDGQPLAPRRRRPRPVDRAGDRRGPRGHGRAAEPARAPVRCSPSCCPAAPSRRTPSSRRTGPSTR